jgi:hypothetical protein
MSATGTVVLVTPVEFGDTIPANGSNNRPGKTCVKTGCAPAGVVNAWHPDGQDAKNWALTGVVVIGFAGWIQYTCRRLLPELPLILGVALRESIPRWAPV